MVARETFCCEPEKSLGLRSMVKEVNLRNSSFYEQGLRGGRRRHFLIC